MDDDLLFGGQHRFSPDRQWAGSPPSCSQQDDGYRITWGPSMNSVLASCKVNTTQSSSKIKSSSLLANVKRSSASAGFPSPTRPLATTSSTNPRSNANTSQNSASDTSADTSASSVSSSSSTAAASRLFKRRRRFLPSSSTPALDFDVSARINTSHGPRSLSADDTSSDVTEMLGELARRLQASRDAAAEQGTHLRRPLVNKENIAPGRADQVATVPNNAKGKQREKIAVSPAVSTVVEESMSQGMAGMLLNSVRRNSSSNHQSEGLSGTGGHRHAAGNGITQSRKSPGIVVPPRTSLKDSGYTSRGYVDVNAENCRPEGKCETRQRTYKQNMDPATDVLGNSDRGVDQVALLPPDIPAESLAPFTVKLEGEEDLWDENDKSLEIAMSQMDIPDPPSSQQGVRSQSASALNLPHPPARLLQPSHEGESKDWEGFKSRDKRVREKSSDSSNASVSKLSSKPLVASQNKQQKPMKLESNDSAFTACSPTSVGKAEPVRDFSKSISASSDKLRLVPTRPVMASARSCGSNTMTAPGLSKKFKCPTITNTAAARAEQEKKAAAAAKLVQRAGQPLPAEEAWMEDMDWNVDDSF